MLRQGAPDTMKAFGALSTAATATNAIDTKVKELMALAISVVKRCDGCIAYHAKGAAARGASAAEVADALGVALLMDGGTASVYGPRAWAAFEEFSDAAAQGTPR